MTFAKTESFEMSKVLVVFVCVLLGVLGEEDGNEGIEPHPSPPLELVLTN